MKFPLDFFVKRYYNSQVRFIGMWLSLVEHYVRDVGAAGSNPVIPTTSQQTTLHLKIPAFGWDFLICSVAAPFPKKVTLVSPMPLQARADGSTALPTFSGLRLRRNVSFLAGQSTSEQALHAPIFYACIKNQSPAPLRLLFRKKARQVAWLVCKRTHSRFVAYRLFASAPTAQCIFFGR